MKLLVVEDEVALADALSEILKRNKYSVDTVYDGEDGLDYALTGIYDCILLDIMLPKKDGISVLRALRTAKISTPVLLLTAKSDTEDKIKGLDSGADDYLTKPFVSVTFTKLTLDTRSDTLLNTTEFSVVDGTLAIADIDFSCCIGFVHTSDRKVSDCTLLSINSEFIEHFTSEEQWQEARNSYGTSTSELLFNDDQGSIYDNVAGED